jgi:CRISPR-associated protein Cas1
MAGPHERSLAALEAEAAPWPEGLDEVCLDFITPLEFRPADPKRRWLIDRQAFMRLLIGRLKTLFGVDIGRDDPDWDGLALNTSCWHFDPGEERKPASNDGRQMIKGVVGPLYVRGEIARIRPLLLACSELHAGKGDLSWGRGRYVIRLDRTFFDRRLSGPKLLQEAFDELQGDGQLAGTLAGAGVTQERLDSLAGDLAADRYVPAPCRLETIPKHSGGTRGIAILPPVDHLVEKALHRLVRAAWDRLFDECSVGYRAGRSREVARRMVDEAWREGFGVVLEADIASFFDQVPWDVVERRLNDSLPRADRVTRRLMSVCLRRPAERNGKKTQRDRGLLQGSPLSPLLANLVLDPFDRAMEERGHRLVRYADDFLVLARTREEAESAREDAGEILAGLGLALKLEKTRVHTFEEGFSFLGFTFGGDLPANLVDQAIFRKPLFIKPEYAFIGCEGDSLTVRHGHTVTDRFPLVRVSELVLLGPAGISTKIMERCACMGIPISFCAAAGHYLSTLWPETGKHLEENAKHTARRWGIANSEVLELARRLVEAKVENYRAWLNSGDDAAINKDLAAADTIDQIRGIEGHAAKAIFRQVNDRVSDEFFASRTREPHHRFDPYNALLDFAYFLLFNRLNVLVRARSLNPFLGFLHSPADRYESLVCDLMEPFRWRMDRLVIGLVRQGIIRPEHYERREAGAVRLSSEAAGTFVEHFERELLAERASGAVPLAHLLAAQVAAVRLWADGGGPPRFHRAGRQDNPARKKPTLYSYESRRER